MKERFSGSHEKGSALADGNAIARASNGGRESRYKPLFSFSIPFRPSVCYRHVKRPEPVEKVKLPLQSQEVHNNGVVDGSPKSIVSMLIRDADVVGLTDPKGTEYCSCPVAPRCFVQALPDTMGYSLVERDAGGGREFPMRA
jgi:hypothetical protein